MKASKEQKTVTLGVEMKTPNFYLGGPYKWDVRTASIDCYNKFKLENPTITITKEQFRDIIHDINGAYVNYIVTTGNAVTLPYGIGKLCVNKFRRTKTVLSSKDFESNYYSMAVDWAKTRKAGKIVYFLNEDSCGYTYSYKWFKGDAQHCTIKNAEFWRMKMCEQGCKWVLRDFLRDPEKMQTVNYRETGTTKSNLLALKHEKALRYAEQKLQ